MVDAYAAVAEAQDRTGGVEEDPGEVEEEEEPEEEPEEDATAPHISGLWVDVGAGWFEIRWDTDEPATSEVVFDPWGSYPDAELTTEHAREFNASCNARYEFKVRSEDALGNAAETIYYYVITDPC